jgi:hypothetical protein
MAAQSTKCGEKSVTACRRDKPTAGKRIAALMLGMSDQNRVHKGVPAGGQFDAHNRAESAVSLTAESDKPFKDVEGREIEREGKPFNGTVFIRERARRGVGSDIALALLEMADPNWRDHKSDVKWLKNLQLIVEFRQREGFLPRYGAELGSEEKRLHRWLDNRRRDASGKTVGAMRFLRLNRGAILDEKLPGWRADDVDEMWLARLDAIVEFRSTENHLPRSSAPIGSDECVMYKWLDSRRGEANGKGDGASKFLRLSREKILDEKLPGWKNDVDKKWLARLDAAAALRDAENHLPRSVAPVDSDEYALYMWIQKLRQEAKGNGSGAAKFARLNRAALLDAALPGWRGSRTHT